MKANPPFSARYDGASMRHEQRVWDGSGSSGRQLSFAPFPTSEGGTRTEQHKDMCQPSVGLPVKLDPLSAPPLAGVTSWAAQLYFMTCSQESVVYQHLKPCTNYVGQVHKVVVCVCPDSFRRGIRSCRCDGVPSSSMRVRRSNAARGVRRDALPSMQSDNHKNCASWLRHDARSNRLTS